MMQPCLNYVLCSYHTNAIFYSIDHDITNNDDTQVLTLILLKVVENTHIMLNDLPLRKYSLQYRLKRNIKVY